MDRKHALFAICYLLFAISLVFMPVLVPSTAAGAGEETALSVTAKVDKETVNIGDRIKLDLTARPVKGLEISFTEKPEKLGEFAFIEGHQIKQKWGKSQEKGYEYVVGIYTTGTHVIPPIPVRYRKIAAEEWLTAESPQVPIEVKSVLTGQEKDIKELKGPIVFRSRYIWLLMAIGAALIPFVAWFLWSKGKSLMEGYGKARKKAAHEIAYEELAMLKKMDLPEKGIVKEYYERLSDIIRHYIENRFLFRAPEMTTEEFMEAMKRSDVVSNDNKGLLKEFLSHCDMVKFAKYGPTKLEMIDSYKAAERFVDETKLLEKEENIQG